MLGVLKSAGESLLLLGGPAAISRRAFRNRCLILAYHNILPDGTEPGADRSLHLPRADFAQHLDQLTRHCDVVSLDAALSGSHSPSRRPRVAITFDDAYSGAMTVGVDELVQRGLPATFFVCPAFIGGRSFWWDVVRSGRNDRSLASLRETSLSEWKGQDDQIRAKVLDSGFQLEEPKSYARAATEAELTRAASMPGLVLGSHTWSHPNLRRLSDVELPCELQRPLMWLRERFRNVCSWLSYPYGLGDTRVSLAARSAGYQGALLVEGGWLPKLPSDWFQLPRLNVPAGATIKRFSIQIAGLLSG
jgi:peptidoglycan/xylan/chitin deacetylase (PgdA/CDA1 family)